MPRKNKSPLEQRGQDFCEAKRRGIVRAFSNTKKRERFSKGEGEKFFSLSFWQASSSKRNKVVPFEKLTAKTQKVQQKTPHKGISSPQDISTYLSICLAWLGSIFLQSKIDMLFSQLDMFAKQTRLKKHPVRKISLRGAKCINYSTGTSAICNSSSCFCSTAEGASIIRSCAFLFMGNGIISRMESSPARSITIRSTPGAIPA